MSRKIIISFVACLLCLLPSLSQAQSLFLYEYWFDDDFGSRVVRSMSGSDTEVSINANTALLDNGVHKFSFRAMRSDGKYSAITSSLFLKRTAAQSSQMEYWFDDNFDQRDIIPIAFTDEEQTFNLNLQSNTKYPIGFHKLNMRVTLEGEGTSAVYQAGVLKLSAGKATRLECWIDDDRTNLIPLEGRESSGQDGYIFVSDLDLGAVSPGHHRLYCRAVSNSGKTVSAITSVPIIVKSRYNVAPDDVRMSSFSISVDNEEPILASVSGKELNLNPYSIDVRNLAVGNHTLKAHFWNSANAGVYVEQNFKVNAIETPTIQLTADVNDGMVTLRFNSIPNDVKWDIFRTSANHSTVKAAGKTQSRYPSRVTYIDSPPAGEYTYAAKSEYLDANGNRQTVLSNKVTVTVAAPQTNQYGIVRGNVKVGQSILWGERWTVTFSDSVEVQTDVMGSFYRDKIPVGTVLEISARSRDYTSDVQTLTVVEGENPVYLQGTFDEERVMSRYSHDLEFDSNVMFAPRLHMKFKVKNITRVYWKGRLRILTARKEYVDNPPKNPFESDDAQQLAGSVAPFTVNDYYQYDYSDELSLGPGESADVFISHHVPITTPPTGKDELYYFFVESVDQYGSKLVAINDDYNIKENPMVQLVDNGEYNSEEEDIETCVDYIMALCSTIKELDGKLGDMSRCMKEMQETLGDALTYDDLAGVIERSGSYIYIRENIPSWHFMRILFNEDRRFLGMVTAVRDKISKVVRASGNALQYAKKAKYCLDQIRNYNEWQDLNDLERAGAVADKILNMSESTFPFAKVLKTYLDVTKKTIHNINGLAEKWDAINNYSTFYSGAELYYNDFVFDIRVKKKGWITSFFNADEVKEQILSAEIKCIGHIPNVSNGLLDCTATYTPELVDGKVRLRCISIVDNCQSDGREVPIEDMWMTIWWSNGRVSYIPIRSSAEVQGNGVTHERNHYTITFQSGANEKEYMADIIQLDD